MFMCVQPSRKLEILTLEYAIFQNGQTNFKNLVDSRCMIDSDHSQQGVKRGSDFLGILDIGLKVS